MTPDPGASGYHATVHKTGGLWVYQVFGSWDTPRQETVMRGTSRDWLTAFARAAGTVSAFRWRMNTTWVER